MSGKHIIILGTAYPFRGGGISTYNERLAKAYLDRGDEVVIYTFSLQYPSFFFPGKTQYSEEAPPEGLDIRVKVNSVNPLNWIRIGLELKKMKPDVLVVRYWTPFMAPCLGSISRIVRRNRHSRVVAITDNIIPHEKIPGGKLLSGYFAGSCDGFVAMSKAVMADLEEINATKPRRYNPHPLYDNFGSPVTREKAIEKLGLDPAFRYILFFGFIRDYKGLDLLIEAFAHEKLRDFPVKVIVAGEFYVDPAPYLSMISKLGLEDDFILRTSFIPNTEIVNYFCASDLVVQPYKHATQSGITQVAYHFNKPMLITNVGGLSEMVPDGKVGYVVEPDSTKISLSLIDYFETDKEAGFIANIKEEKKRFSWDQLLNTIDEISDYTRNI